MRTRPRSGLLGGAILLVAVGAAPAHAPTEATTPADGATLAAAPARIAVTFGAPVRVTAIGLENEAGESFPVERGAMQPTERFETPVPDLPPGRYRVEWRALADDGHAMSGGFGFTVE